MTERDDFLKDLTRLIRQNPTIEAQVFWSKDGDWSDATGELLDAEEVPYYAEGLVMEGFGLCWRLLQSQDRKVELHLYCWQSERPDLPQIPAGLSLSATGEVKGQ